MPRPGWLIIVVVLGLLSVEFGSGAAHAAKIPFLQETLTGESEKKQLPQPKPTDLVSGWWHYFDVEQSQLEPRITATISDLEEQLKQLPQSITEQASAFVELIKANLNALPDLRAKKNQQPPATPAYAEQYTLAQLLSIDKNLRELSAVEAIKRIDLDTAKQSIERDQRRNDTQFASYLSLATSDPQRVMTGLEMMADRTALLLAEQRFRVHKAELDAISARIKQLSDELAVAKERLTAEPAERERLAGAVIQAEAEYAVTRDRVITEQANASAVSGDNPQEVQATEQYRQQRVIKAQVEEAHAAVRVLTLQAEHDLANLLIDKVIDNSEILRTELNQSREKLATLQQKIQTWMRASEWERQRAGSVPGGSLSLNDPETSAYITFLNQDRFVLAQETLVALQGLQGQMHQAELVLALINEQLQQREGRIRDWLARSQQFFVNLWMNAASWVNVSLFTIGDTPVTALGILRIVLILTIAWWISHWLRRALNQIGTRSDSSNSAALYTVGRLSHYLIIIIGFLVGLSSIGMDFTNFALVAGALAIGIGFGLQAIVNNFISGLILLFERSLKVGDFVDLGSGVAGEVKAINVRSTQIKTNENIDIVVPNSEFMNANVINWTLQEPYLRSHYPFKVSYGSDKEKVRKAGLEAAENVAHTLSGIPGKNPQVWLIGFGENGYDFELVVWLIPSAVKRPSAVRAAYYWELETALKKYDIEVPVPQRDLYLRGGFDSLNTDEFPEANGVQSPVPLRRSSGG